MVINKSLRYFIMAQFDYLKHDSRLAAYGGVELQQFESVKVCRGKSHGNRHYRHLASICGKARVMSCVIKLSCYVINSRCWWLTCHVSCTECSHKD